MSKNINVNPDHYKLAGRERPGEGLNQEESKRELAMQENVRERQRNRKGQPAAPVKKRKP